MLKHPVRIDRLINIIFRIKELVSDFITKPATCQSQWKTAHPNRLITIFAIRVLESIILNPGSSEISPSYLVAVAEQAGLGMTWSATRNTWFLATWPDMLSGNDAP